MQDLDETRRQVSQKTSIQTKSQLGQYLTPSVIAHFMASMFSEAKLNNCTILDPGAGLGILSSAFADRMSQQKKAIFSMTAVECDNKLIPYLTDTYAGIPCSNSEIVHADFLETALNWIQFEPQKRFSHIIMNPPYKKIASSSSQRKLLRCADIETVNLYSGFVALCILLLKEHGELVAIVPRSFCNGPYYKSFRKLIISNTQLTHIHLFESRKDNFSDDGVLQENVIIKLTREIPQGHEIKISWSTDSSFSDYREYRVTSGQVIYPDDAELFIRIPLQNAMPVHQQEIPVNHTLKSLDLSVSTGPIVDFRARPFLCQSPREGTIPLIYPLHLGLQKCSWPQLDSRKPNSIISNDDTAKMFFPNGYYCAVKRFSSKEEKRRIFACVISPADFHNPQYFGFENHLNIYHHNHCGLDKDVAYGLMVFLNSKAVDNFFRTFSGHTQVNAADLKQIHYPSIDLLKTWGKWAQEQSSLSLEQIDQKVETALCLAHAINI